MTSLDPKISILCVNFNGGKQIYDFLKSLQKLNWEENRLETLVIDNGSQDQSQKAVLRFKNVELIQLDKNYGYGPAINMGLQRTTGQYILIANNDIEIEKNCLKALCQYSQNHPEAAIIGGKILSKTKRNQIASSYQTFNYLTGAVKMNSKKIEKPTEVQWVQGCAMFIPMEKLKIIGPFDPGFEKIYFEDLDLCRRAQLALYKTVIIPNAIFYHHQSYTMDTIVSKKFKWYNWHKNKIRFILKHATLTQIISVLLVEAVSSLFQSFNKQSFSTNKQPQIGQFIKAVISNFKNINEIRDKRAKLYG